MTNEEKLRETFPNTIFIFRKNGNNETAAIMVSDEWLQGDYDQMYKDSAHCEDAIDRQALRARFNHLDEVYEGMSEEEKHEAYIYGQIIRAIDDAPPVTPKSLDSVLDRIKEEIFLLPDNECNGHTVTVYSWRGMQKKVLDIIDKYKGK